MSKQPPATVPEPTALFRAGKLSYAQIPAADVGAAGRFYEAVFGWEVRWGGSHRAFEDTTGEMMGAFVTDLAPATEGTGVLPYIYVESVDATLGSVASHGGATVREPYPEGDLWVAKFRDPVGNVMGVWQAGSR